jgi:antitoxin FitA
MSQILVRELPEETVNNLKRRAKRNGRSLEGEVRIILEQIAGFSAAKARKKLGDWQKTFSGRKLKDSVSLVREDRRR